VRARIPRSRVTHDRWLISYADFITLLFAFFVVLYASAMQGQKKQAEISVAIDSAFRSLGLFGTLTQRDSGKGLDQPVVSTDLVMREQLRDPAQVKQELETLQDELRKSLSKELDGREVSIRMGRDGLVISLREAGFFDSGSARPKPQAISSFGRIASGLRRSRLSLRVEGHTDNVPIHTAEFDSNWELSAARATSVARLLLAMQAMPPERVSAAGYAEFHPVDSNATAAGRANNRRVDLVIAPRTRTSFAGPNDSETRGPWRKITDEDQPSH
jgi:chemotaxis protein MotB